MKSILRSAARKTAILAAVLVGTASVYAQQAKPFTKGTVLVVDYVALDKMLPDAKDRPLAAALAMIPARVRELPREIRQMPPDAARLINTALTCIGKPGRLTVAYNGENPSGGLFGYGVAFSFLVDDQKLADELHATVSKLLADTGAPPIKTAKTRWAGMSDIQTPVGLLSFGPRQAKDGWRYEVVFGTMENADAAAEVLPTTKDFEPLVRARLDFAGLTPLRDTAKQLAGGNPQVQEMVQGLEKLGLVGDNAVKINYLAGNNKEESVSLTTWEGVKKYAAAMRMSQKPLTTAELSVVPSDATDAMIARMGEDGFGFFLDSLSQMGEQGEMFLEEFQNQTGVNLRTDILDAVGGTGVMYLSDTTGGGGLMSAVGMMSFRDRAKFMSAMTKLSAAANAMADHIPIGPGYIRLTSWKDGETDLLTLRFPGLPVPLEISFAMTANWLIFSPTPQGAIAASRQASGKGDGGLMANPAFKSRYPSDKKLVSVAFSDTAKTLRDGYAAMSMVGSAIANGMRSPTDPTREPGVVVPLFNDLKKDVKSRLSYSYWRGEDMISETRSDRSAVVGATSALALIQKVIPLIAIPAAIAGGADEFKRIGQGPDMDAGRMIVRYGLRAMPMGTLGPAETILTLLPADMLADHLVGGLKGAE